MNAMDVTPRSRSRTSEADFVHDFIFLSSGGSLGSLCARYVFVDMVHGDDLDKEITP